MNTLETNPIKELEDGTYLVSVELPRSAIGDKGRSIMLRFYPKTAKQPISSVALDYEFDGSIYQLAEGLVNESLFNEIIETQ